MDHQFNPTPSGTRMPHLTTSGKDNPGWAVLAAPQLAMHNSRLVSLPQPHLLPSLSLMLTLTVDTHSTWPPPTEIVSVQHQHSLSTNSLLHQAHHSFQDQANVQLVPSPFHGMLEQTQEVLALTNFHTQQVRPIATLYLSTTTSPAHRHLWYSEILMDN